MPNTNLDDLILAEYASGTLGEAQSVLVASHLTLCPESRKKAELLDQIGGLYISEAESSSLASNTFDKVIARIDNDRDADCKQDEDVVSSDLAIIPKPIFISNITQVTGIAISTAPRNIVLLHAINSGYSSEIIIRSPIGINLKLSSNISISITWPPIARKIRVPKIVSNCPMTGTVPRFGSARVAIANPIVVDIV